LHDRLVDALKAIARYIAALILGVALLAGAVAHVPGPTQILAAWIGLPIQSLHVAVATSLGRNRTDQTSPQTR
jgi:hypothetical protein